MHFATLIIWEIKFQSSDLILSQNFVPLSPSLSTHLLLSSSSYPWLPMVVSMFLTHLLLEVVSPITFPPSPFRYHWSSRNKGLHWWRRSKVYKLYMKPYYTDCTTFVIFLLRCCYSVEQVMCWDVWHARVGCGFKFFKLYSASNKSIIILMFLCMFIFCWNSRLFICLFFIICYLFIGIMVGLVHTLQR